MHRFWFFPLLLAIVGALYPFITTMEGWTMTQATIGLFASDSEIADSLVIGAPLGALIGVTVGMATALSDFSRHLQDDRSGIEGTRRLVANLLWFGAYASVVNTINTALPVVIIRFLVPLSLLRYWMPAIPFLLFGLANLAAILWAAISTTQNNSALSPLVIAAKLKRSSHIES